MLAETCALSSEDNKSQTSAHLLRRGEKLPSAALCPAVVKGDDVATLASQYYDLSLELASGRKVLLEQKSETSKTKSENVWEKPHYSGFFNCFDQLKNTF